MHTANTSLSKVQVNNLNNEFIRLIFKFFRQIFAFSPRQGERPALDFGSKSKNLFGKFLNLLPNKPIIQVNKKSPLTLLEVLIGMALLAIAITGVGWKAQQVLAQKRFESGFQKFCSKIETLHHLALAMQADWRACLHKQKGAWVFETRCVDQPDARPLSSFSLGKCDLFVEGIKQEELQLDFFATGEVSPLGSCCFVRNESRRLFRLSEMLHRESGDGKKKLGPLHPDDIPK